MHAGRSGAGDLTGRAPDPTRSLPEDAPPVDACGYDEHMRRRAWTVPAGLAMFVAGFGVAIAFSNMNGANPGARPYIAYFACATVGFALLIRAFAVHGSFRRRHPYIEDFYTDDQRVAARKEGKRSAVGGLVLLCASLFFASPGAIALADTLNLWGLMANVWNVYGTLPLLLFALLAASVALLVHAAMVVCLINVARYNRDSERKAEAASHLVAAMQARLAQSAGAAETGAGADATPRPFRIPTKRTSASPRSPTGKHRAVQSRICPSCGRRNALSAQRQRNSREKIP